MKKSKKGFTLVEMMLVVAIVVVLAGVGALAIGETLGKSKNRQTEYETHTNSIEVAQLRVHNIIATTRAPRMPVAGSGGTNGGTGGGNPTTGGGGTNPTTTTTRPTSTPRPTTSTPRPTAHITTTPSVPSVSPTAVPTVGSYSDSNVSASFVGTGKGTRDVRLNGDGTYTIIISNDDWNMSSFTIDSNGNVSGISGNGTSGTWIINNMLNGRNRLNASDLVTLKNDFGLNLPGIDISSTPTPSAPSGGGTGGSGESGSVSAPSGTVTSGRGVYEVTTSGGVTSVTIGADQYNRTSFTISGNTITFSSNKYNLQNDGLSFSGVLWQGDSFTLTAEDKVKLESIYGLHID